MNTLPSPPSSASLPPLKSALKPALKSYQKAYSGDGWTSTYSPSRSEDYLTTRMSTLSVESIEGDHIRPPLPTPTASESGEDPEEGVNALEGFVLTLPAGLKGKMETKMRSLSSSTIRPSGFAESRRSSFAFSPLEAVEVKEDARLELLKKKYSVEMYGQLEEGLRVLKARQFASAKAAGRIGGMRIIRKAAVPA